MPAPNSILHRHRVEVALSRRLTEQEALVELSELALEGGDPDRVMQVAAERLVKIQEVEVVVFNELVDPGHMVARALVGPVEDQIGVRYRIDPRTSDGYALHNGVPVLVEHLPSDPRFPGESPLGEMGWISGMNIVIPSPNGVYGLLGLWTKEPRRFSAEDVHFVQAVANLVGGVVTRTEVENRLAEAVREKDRRLRNERAISKCAQALLGDNNPAAVETSLRALMESTNASFGYVDWLDRKDGSIPSVRRDRQGRCEALDRYWEQVSWDDLPTLRDRLVEGNPVAVKVSELPPHEAAVFLTGPELVASEIDIPIMINGKWAGTVGLGDQSESRIWEPAEVQTLQMAGSLLASWWERRDYAERLEEVLASRDRSLRLEQAVAAASQVLTRAAHPDDIQPALEALLEGTDASSVFVERNVADPIHGFCSKVQAVAQRPGAGYDPRYWDMMPWDRMPTTRAVLAQGREMVLSADTLEGAEAATYAGSAVKSEIDVPIVVDGHWEGLIGLSDERMTRTWDDELQMLRTAADMIASFWRRLDSTRRLEELMASKDEFIASISHELRTPLTAVVGLAEALADPANRLPGKEAGEFIQIIAEQSAEMSAIVQDLLVVARSDIGRVTIRPIELDLRVEVEASIRGLRPDRRSLLAVTGQARAVADPVRVRQIVRNLLANAGRYGGPHIRVQLEERSERSVVMLMDDGPGIAASDWERIFQPYERAHERDGQPAAVGLGLTVSRQLARLMGGSLYYDHKDGWSTFTLELPRSVETRT
ncbi:MAG: GAF domain-containing protein [Acidimicrobiia bacterium]